MKKNMIALAVAAAVVAPSAMASATLYGLANVSMYKSSGDTALTELTITDTASRIGIKGDNDLGDGLKAIYQMEFQVQITGDGKDGASVGQDSFVNRNAQISNRNQFAGLAGGFGTVMLGNMDSPLKSAEGKIDMFADTLSDMSAAKDGDAKVKGEDRYTNSLTYVSPKFEGMQVAIQNGEVRMDNGNGATEETSLSYSLSYTGVKGLFVAVAGAMDANGTKGLDQMALTASYAMDDMKAGFIYETEETADGKKRDLGLVNAAYTMDNVTYKVQYAMVMKDEVAAANEDDSHLSLGIDYGFNKSTKAYALYNVAMDEHLDATLTSKSTDVSSVQIGLLTKF